MTRKIALVAALVLHVGCGAEDDYIVVRGACEAIVQGEVVHDPRLPTVATGHYAQDGEFIQTCTGTYIAPGVVLTAAHCGNIAAVEHDGEIRNNIMYLPHPDHSGLDNDLALVFLDGELSVRPATLGVADYGLALVQGYGIDENRVNGILREATTTVSQFWAPDTLITSPGPDSCYGDSGGPLYQGGALVAVTRSGIYGRDCGEGGMYTLVISHKNWLDSEVDHLNWAASCGTL